MTMLFSENFANDTGHDQNPLTDSGSPNFTAGAWTSPWTGKVRRQGGVTKAELTGTHSLARCETAIAPGQYAKLTNINTAGGSLAGVFTRVQADGSGYALYYWPSQGRLSFFRSDAGSFSAELAHWGVTTGANVTIEMRSPAGARHFAFFNGAYVGSFVETMYGTGKTGHAYYDDGAGSTSTYFEAGTSNGLLDDYPTINQGATNFELFSGSEPTLNESGHWLIPNINSGTDATRHWLDGCQKSYAAFGRASGNHNCSYLAGSYTDNQYAAAIIDVGVFAGVATRMRTNGDCYFAFAFNDHAGQSDLRLYRYTDVGDAGADPAEGFNHGILVEKAYTFISSHILLELYSQADKHYVYATNPGGVRTLIIDPNVDTGAVDATYLTGGAPGITPFSDIWNVYAFWGGNYSTTKFRRNLSAIGGRTGARQAVRH